jgi:hypothetical protein
MAGNDDQPIAASGLPHGLPATTSRRRTELFGLRIWGTPWRPWFWARRSTPRRDSASGSLPPLRADSGRYRDPDLPRAAARIRRPHRSLRRTAARCVDGAGRADPAHLAAPRGLAATSTPATAGTGSAQRRSSPPRSWITHTSSSTRRRDHVLTTRAGAAAAASDQGGAGLGRGPARDRHRVGR